MKGTPQDFFVDTDSIRKMRLEMANILIAKSGMKVSVLHKYLTEGNTLIVS